MPLLFSDMDSLDLSSLAELIGAGLQEPSGPQSGPVIPGNPFPPEYYDAMTDQIDAIMDLYETQIALVTQFLDNMSQLYADIIGIG